MSFEPPWLGLRALSCALALTASAAATARARSAVVDLDPGRTVVRFTVGGTLHETHGTFRLARGTLEVDPATGAARGDVVVDATSGDSGSAARDRRMTDLVLQASAHTEIELRPTRIDGALAPDGTFDGTVHGLLTLTGASHEIDLAAHGRVTGADLTATCRFSIPYVAWGLADPSILFLEVAKEVVIDVDTAGHVAWQDPPIP